jgi:hypothetical protein
MKIYRYLGQIAPIATLATTLIATTISPGFAQTTKRDYEFSTPLSQTKRLTIRQPLQALPSDRLFAQCPSKSQLTEFAESTTFVVMVCREGGDRGLTKHWLQKNKKTGKQMQLTVQDQPNSQPSNWQSGDYQVYIYADGRNPNSINAYLESYNTKTKLIRAEALIYHYATGYKP